MNRILTAIAVAVLACSANSAWATHGTAAFVDAIDGSGPGTFIGSIGSSGNSTAAWYSFSATAGAMVTLETTAATYDTHLKLFSVPGIPMAGDARALYTEIASDDDSGVGLLSFISAGPLAAGNYMVAVEEFGGGGGNFTLQISGTGISAISTAEVPEPTSVLLWAVGALGFAGVRKLRRKGPLA